MLAQKHLRFAFFRLLPVAAPCCSALLSAGGFASAGEPRASSKPASSKPSKAKKVWTEDDMGRLNSPVSIVGGANSSSSALPSQSPASAAKDTSYYRQRLAVLRAQLQQNDDQRRAIRTSKLGGRENIQRIIEDLEIRKKDVLSRMDALEEQARKEGVDSSQLR